MTKRMIISVLFTLLVGSWGVCNAQSILSSPDAADVESVTLEPVAGTPLLSGGPKLQVAEPADEELGYFVLSIPPVPEEVVPRMDVVILCDTSASMSGGFREEQLMDLELILDSLTPSDRVQIYGCDTQTIPLTKGFVTLGSAELNDALAKLNARVPLGSSDLEKTLNAAAASFGDSSSAQKAVVYLGQGTSRANLLLPQEVAALADNLAGKQVSFFAVAMGPNQDIVMLKTLSAKTGGMVTATQEESFAEFIPALRRKVAWPKSENHGFKALYPSTVPPLRSDRDTVVVGTIDKGKDSVVFSMDFEDPAFMPLKYQLAPKTLDAPYILNMVKAVQKNNGWLPLESWDDVENVMVNAKQSADSLVALANEMLDGNNVELAKADELIQQAVQQDPTNPNVQKTRDIIEQLKIAQRDGTGMVPGFDVGDALGEQVATDNAATQAAKVDVQNVVNNARQLMSTRPEEAIDILNIKMEEVRTLGLPAEVEETLVKQLQASIREAKSRAEALAIKDQEDRTRLAEMRERQIALDNAKTERQKIQQMMRRFDSLMEEGKYREAEENVAQAVLEKDPTNVAAVAGTITARFTGYDQQSVQTNVRRNKGFVDALHQVELAHVPFPDEPPVTYPDSEVWKRLTERRVEKYKSMDLAQRGEAERKIMEKLKEATTINASDSSLADIISDLKKRHDIEIQIDTAAIEEDGMFDLENDTISMDIGGVSLGAALRLMLNSRNMMYVVEDEVLKITSQTKASESQSTRVYPVADLVIPIQNVQAPMNSMSGMGGGGGMGGMGGMGGGMGGGMMGGMGGGMGMGGMGGGMGGMGGGMGGFMNNPAEAVQRANAVKKNAAAQGAFFDVPEAKIVKKSPKAAKKASPEKWNTFFKGLKGASEEKVAESQAKVREIVRQMRADKRFADIIVVIEAALQNNQGQPWMYETLTIAMVMEGRPADEVERAMSSALEFCENPNQMLLIGSYMEGLNLYDRAFAIYRQLGKMYPNDPEPFVFAMNLARRADVDNVEALKWSTLGLLKQEVGAQRQRDWQNAQYCAKALVERLQKEGKADEAAKFADEMAVAMQRDCRITVSWTGDADIDLYVEEPDGSVCSLANRRTPGGGFLASDGFSKEDSNRDESARISETYVCSQGFSGTYRLIAKRVWGEVTGNKVIVETVIHDGSGAEKRMKRAIPIENDLVGVEFVLDEGRRTESLDAQRLINTVQDAREAQVAQQLFENVDHKALADYGENTTQYYPYSREGAVGYMPLIVTLQPGAALGATGVVSADRRYVRISAGPSFSSIGRVTVFNFVTGEASDYDGSQGVGGGSNNLTN